MQSSALLAAAALLFFCVVDAQNASPIVLSQWSFDDSVTAHSRGVGWNTTQVGNNSCSPASAPTCDVSVTPAHGAGFLSTAIYASLNASADNYYLLQNASRSANISIAAYIYLTQPIGAYNILQKQTATDLWRFEVANRYLSFAFSDADVNNTVTYMSAQQISVNKWQYVTFTHAADTEKVTMSINAQPQSISSFNSDYVTSSIIDGGLIEFVIGNGDSFIDELRLIAGVISGQDTLNLVQHNKLIPPLLHAGYNYDDPFNPLVDRSGNGFHLQSTGFVNTTDGAVKTAVLIESQLSSNVSNFMCNPLLRIPLGFTITTYINSDEEFSSIITISNENQTLFALDIAPLNNSLLVSFNNVSASIIYSSQPWAHIAIVVDAITSQFSVYNDAQFVYSTYVNLAIFCQFASQNEYTLILGGIHSSRGGPLRRLFSTGGTLVDQTSIYGTPFTAPFIYYTMNTGANCFSDIGCSSYQLPFDYNLTNLVTGINASADCTVAGTQTVVPLYGISSTQSKFGPGSLQNLGSCSQSVDLSIGPSTTSNTSDMTLNMWVLLPPSTAQQSYILSGSASTGTFSVACYPNKGTVRFYFPGFTTTSIPTTATARNVWHQLSIVFSWELQFAQVFWDGTVYSTGSVTSFSISSITIGNTFTSQFTGLVDAFSIYNLYFDNGLLNFIQLYNTIFPCWSVALVPPPVVWIPLQNSFVDISNSTHNTTIYGTVSGYDFTTTSSGQIVWYQQPTSFGAEGGLIIENFVVPTVFSASVWVNSNTNTDCRFFLGEPGGTTGYDGGTPGGLGLGICPYYADTALPTLIFQVSVYAYGEQQDIELGYEVPVSFPVNTWINLIATLDVNGYAALYMNGSLVTSSQLLYSDYLTAWQTAARQPVTIGFNGVNSVSPNVYYNALNGYIQDVLIFNYALNASQAANIYSAGFNDAVGSCQQACLPGTYSSTGYASVGQCTPCPINTNTSLYAAQQCQPCPFGYGTNSTGNTVCSPLCAPGYWSPDGSVTTGCQACPLNFYSSIFGATYCQACPVGTNTTQTASSSCQYCPADPSITQCGQFNCGDNFAIGFDATLANVVQVDMRSTQLLQTLQFSNPSTVNFTVAVRIFPQPAYNSNQILYIISKDGLFRLIFNCSSNQVGLILPLFMSSYVYSTVQNGIPYNSWTHVLVSVQQNLSISSTQCQFIPSPCQVFPIYIKIYINGSINNIVPVTFESNPTTSSIAASAGYNSVIYNTALNASQTSAVLIGACLSTVPNIAALYASPDITMMGQPGLVPCDSLPVLFGLVNPDGSISSTAVQPSYFTIDTFITELTQESLQYNQLMFSIFEFALNNLSAVALWNSSAISGNPIQLQQQYGLYDHVQALLSRQSSNQQLVQFSLLPDQLGFFNGYMDDVLMLLSAVNDSQAYQISFQPLYAASASDEFPTLALMLQFEEIYINVTSSVGSGLAYSITQPSLQLPRINSGPLCYPSTLASVGFAPSIIDGSLFEFPYTTTYNASGFYTPTSSYTQCPSNTSNWSNDTICLVCPSGTMSANGSYCFSFINETYWLSLPGFGPSPSRPPNSTYLMSYADVTLAINTTSTISQLLSSQRVAQSTNVSELITVLAQSTSQTIVSGANASSCTDLFSSFSQFMLSNVPTPWATQTTPLINYQINQSYSIALTASPLFVELATRMNNVGSIPTQLVLNQIQLQSAFSTLWQQIHGDEGCATSQLNFAVNVYTFLAPSLGLPDGSNSNSNSNSVNVKQVFQLVAGILSEVIIIAAFSDFTVIDEAADVQADATFAYASQLAYSGSEASFVQARQAARLANLAYANDPGNAALEQAADSANDRSVRLQDATNFLERVSADAWSTFVASFTEFLPTLLAISAVAAQAAAVAVMIGLALSNNGGSNNNKNSDTTGVGVLNEIGVAPSDCYPGTFLNTTAFSTCQPCPTNQISNIVNALACTICAVGFVSVSNQTMCLPCTAGTYFQLSTGTCLPCPPGSFNTMLNSTICTNCPAGSYCPSPASTSATPCSSGSISSVNSTRCTDCAAGTASNPSLTTCIPCGLGAYSGSAASSCIPCEAGKYGVSINGSNTTLSSCSLCPPGSFQNLTQQWLCNLCPVNQSTLTAGSTSCSNCQTNQSSAIGSEICCIGGRVSPYFISYDQDNIVGPYNENAPILLNYQYETVSSFQYAVQQILSVFQTMSTDPIDGECF